MTGSADPFDLRNVRHAYDTVAEDYAARLPDTRAEAPLDLSPGMIEMARRDHGDLAFVVGSLADLPHTDGRFDGVLLWYSIIHTRPAGQPRIFEEAARVLRPGGHVLVGFQSGQRPRDVSAAYRRLDHDVVLQRHLYTADQVAAWLAGAGLRETARLVRRPQGVEKEDQAFVLARRDGVRGA